MSPLNSFLSLVQDLAKRPFSFWKKDDQTSALKFVGEAVDNLERILNGKRLTGSMAYKTLLIIRQVLDGKCFDEIEFMERLMNLLDIYQLSHTDEKTKEFLIKLSRFSGETKKSLLEYHVALEVLESHAQRMTEKEKEERDLDTIQKVGIFYILEYTVYLLSLMPKLSKTDVEKLFFEGLKTKEANLPPFDELRRSFLMSLCYKIFDRNLRDSLLITFYEFEDAYAGKDMEIVLPAFKAFNLRLLKLFQEFGVKNFKTVFLSPFGKNLPMEVLIGKVSGIEVV